jgi:spoIIIJ-associated protein
MEKEIREIEKLARDLLAKLDFSVEAKAKSDGRSVWLDVESAEPGMLIGREGETLSDLQYLIRLIVNRQLKDFIYLTVDINSYRQKQQQQVEREASQAIETVRGAHRSQLLPPMPAASRRIVHLIVKEEEDLESQSVGEEPNRRVLIKIVE